MNPNEIEAHNLPQYSGTISGPNDTLLIVDHTDDELKQLLFNDLPGGMTTPGGGSVTVSHLTDLAYQALINKDADTIYVTDVDPSGGG